MRIESITTTEFARNIATVIDQVRYTGEPIAITKGARTVATLIPPRPTGLPIEELAQLLENTPRLSKEEAKRMADDINKVRHTSAQVLKNPWE